MDVEDKAEADRTDTPHTEDGGQAVLLAAAAEAAVDVFKPQRREGGKDPDGPGDPEVPQGEDLHRPPQEAELPTETAEDLEGPEDTPAADTPAAAGSVHVRRRTRRRRGKKDSH